MGIEELEVCLKRGEMWLEEAVSVACVSLTSLEI